jgi:hypothetical protein
MATLLAIAPKGKILPMTSSKESDQVRPAETTEEAYATLIPDEALTTGDPRYVQLDAARGRTNLAESLTKKITSANKWAVTKGDNFARLLLTGHRGCGKTTELFRLRDLLSAEGFAVVYFDAEAEFDLNKQDVGWWTVLLEMIWQLDMQLSGPPLRLSIPKKQKDDAADWLARLVIKKEERTDLEASLETEFGADAGLPFFVKVKALFKSAVKTGSSHVKEIEREVDRRPEMLLNALDRIIRGINDRLYLNDHKGLVVIVDGLEKMPLRAPTGGITAHNALFVHNGDKLKAPPCHLLYTLPLALVKEVNVSQIFPSEPEIVPMIHVADQTGKVDDGVVAVMRDVLHKRVSANLFEDGVEKMLALASGGHIRDFIRLAREAAGYFGDSITTNHARAAIDRVIDYYDNLYKAEFHDALMSVRENHLVPGGHHDSELIDRLLVLPYRNDKSWYALHPCVANGPRLGKTKRGKAKQKK